MKATKTYTALEFKGCEEENFELDYFYLSLDTGEGVIRFLLVFVLFLGTKM